MSEMPALPLRWWDGAEEVYHLHSTDDYVEYIVQHKGAIWWHYAIVYARLGTRLLVCEWVSPMRLTFKDEDD